MSKINKAKLVLRKLISETQTDETQWIFLGTTKNKKDMKYSVFMANREIYGFKHLVLELNIFDKTYSNPQGSSNNLSISMQNHKEMEHKIEVKSIQSSALLTKLIDAVLENVASYNDDENFEEVYKYLTKS